MNDTMNSSSEDDRGPPPGPPPSVSPPSSPLSSPEYRIENDSVPIMGTSVRNRIQPKETPTVDPSIKDPNKFDGELTGCGGSCFCHPESACHRSIALFLMCILGFGSYFCYDNPGALQKEIKGAMGITTYEFENLYAWYSWPNVVLPIIGGYFVDNVLGMRIAAFVFAAFILLGQILTSLGAFYSNFPLMQFSRFVFGVGGESLSVAQNTYASAWFRGDALNMVFGLQTSIARAGSTVNFQVVGPLYESLIESLDKKDALGWTLAISGLTCVVSVICSIILAIMDKRREKYTHQGLEETPKIHFRDVLVFPASFWLVCLICVGYYVSIFPFVTLSKVYFMEKYNFNSENANFITGLMYLMSAFIAPVIGHLIDRVGRNISFVLAAVIITLLSHCILGFTQINPYFGIVPMGVGYSLLAAALWPIIALIVPLHRQGTAFGLMQAIQNLGLAIISLLAGLIVDEYGYLWLEVFFVFWLALATVATVMLWLVDLHFNDRYLNMSAKERKLVDEKIRVKRLEEEIRLLSSEADIRIY